MTDRSGPDIQSGKVAGIAAGERGPFTPEILERVESFYNSVAGILEPRGELPQISSHRRVFEKHFDVASNWQGPTDE